MSNSVAVWQAFREAYSKSAIFGEGDIASTFKTAADEINTLVSEK